MNRKPHVLARVFCAWYKEILQPNSCDILTECRANLKDRVLRSPLLSGSCLGLRFGLFARKIKN